MSSGTSKTSSTASPRVDHPCCPGAEQAPSTLFMTIGGCIEATFEITYSASGGDTPYGPSSSPGWYGTGTHVCGGTTYTWHAQLYDVGCTWGHNFYLSFGGSVCGAFGTLGPSFEDICDTFYLEFANNVWTPVGAGCCCASGEDVAITFTE